MRGFHQKAFSFKPKAKSSLTRIADRLCPYRPSNPRTLLISHAKDDLKDIPNENLNRNEAI